MILTFLTDIGGAILNGIDPALFIGYVFYMLIGVAISWLSQYVDNARPIKAHGGFKVATWLQENWKRMATVIIAGFLGIVFMDRYTDAEPSNFGALTLGLTLDVLIDRIFNRKK